MKYLRQLIRKSPIWNFNEYERDRWVMRAAQSLPEKTSLLDVGAGSAPYRHLFEHCDYKTQDFSQLSPEQLREHQGYGKIDFVSDITSIPVESNSFEDAVLNTEVIEHVPEPIKAVNEMHRILKPGGKLIITAPLGSGLHQEPYHFYGGYTPFWYNKVLEEAGFEDIKIEPNGGFFKHYGQESIRFCRMSIPWKLFKNPLLMLLWFIPWVFMVPALGIFMPLLCYLLDPLDTYKGFTIGYHVMATKKSAA